MLLGRPASFGGLAGVTGSGRTPLGMRGPVTAIAAAALVRVAVTGFSGATTFPAAAAAAATVIGSAGGCGAAQAGRLLAGGRLAGQPRGGPRYQLPTLLWGQTERRDCRAAFSSTAAAAAAGGARVSGSGNTQHYDAVVVGLGAFGSGALYHLARAGLKVLGIERHRPVGHSLGSSHGASRIIRLAYFEGLQYGPLLKRSMRLFLELQDELAQAEVAAGKPPAAFEPLFLRTGMLDVGSVFQRSLESARVHGLQHEVLTGAELNKRFPAYRVPERWQALFQPDGGVLLPERIVQAHVSLAQRLGADVVVGEAVTSWRTEGSSPGAAVTLQTAPTNGGSGGDGRTVSAAAVVMTPGPWIGQMVPELRELCVPERQVVGWFDIEASSRRHFAPERFPVFVIEESPGGAAYYGFPSHGELPGFKIGLYRHLREQLRDPAAVDAVHRTASAADEAALRAGVSAYFPAAASGALLSASACFFTNTPDGHFLVDRHPRHPQVVLCSACSGHGFKMSSGIGQLMARMVLEGPATAGRGAAAAVVTSAESGEVGAGSMGSGLGVSAIAGGNVRLGGDAGDWGELLPFRFDPVGREGHAETLARFGA